MAEFISVDVEHGVATILLQRPPMNALCLQMQREIRDAAEEVGSRVPMSARSSSTAGRRCSQPEPTSRRWGA